MKIIVVNHLTLDGVYQSPAAPDEDQRGGFKCGGWAVPNDDEVLGKAMAEGIAAGGALLLGRRTYQHFYDFWPKQKDNPFTEVLNRFQKYVASRTLKAPLPWSNSTLLEGDLPEAVAKLRQQPGKNIAVLGSGDLCQTLMRHNLVDEYVLIIHPLVLGAGRRLFPDGGAPATLRLVDVKPTTKGVLLATYRPADAMVGKTR